MALATSKANLSFTQSSKTLLLDNLRTELYLTIQGPDLLTIEIAL